MYIPLRSVLLFPNLSAVFPRCQFTPRPGEPPAHRGQRGGASETVLPGRRNPQPSSDLEEAGWRAAPTGNKKNRAPGMRCHSSRPVVAK